MTKPVSYDGAVNQIAAEAVRLEHVRLRVGCTQEQAHFLAGLMKGLRWSLCVLKGWDPILESGVTGKADRFVTVWHSLPGHCDESGSCSW